MNHISWKRIFSFFIKPGHNSGSKVIDVQDENRRINIEELLRCNSKYDENTKQLEKVSIEIKERDDYIVSLLKQLGDKDFYYTEQIKGKDVYIDSLMRQLDTKNIYLDKQITGKDAYIGNLVRQIKLFNAKAEDAMQENIYLKSIINEFQCEVVIQKCKIRIAIIGDAELYHRICGIIKDNIYVIHYASDIVSSKKIIESLVNSDYDLIILAHNSNDDISLLSNCNISKIKVLNMSKIIHNYFVDTLDLNNQKCFYSYLYYRMNAANKNSEYRICVSGLSYALKGISEKDMIYSCIKIAAPSQDIYYDSLVISKVLHKNEHVKYWIVGISYYAFDFDIKYGSDSFRILNTYYPLFFDSHGLDIPQNYKVEKNMKCNQENSNILNYIFEDSNFPFTISGIFGQDYISETEKSIWRHENQLNGATIEDISEMDRLCLAEQRTAFHNKFDYPNTRFEYTRILQNVLHMFECYNIKPIFVIFPTTSYYRNCFSMEIRNRFYNIINDMRMRHEFQLIDMFDSELFTLGDFADFDHLNEKGAKKMTFLLNSTIQW
jgi:hypothetical protein